MRIIGYIEHPVMKITVFKDNGKLSAKFETGLFEQTYKFREMDTMKNLTDVQGLVDATYQAQVMEHFQTMNQIRNTGLDRFLPKWRRRILRRLFDDRLYNWLSSIGDTL